MRRPTRAGKLTTTERRAEISRRHYEKIKRDPVKLERMRASWRAYHARCKDDPNGPFGNRKRDKAYQKRYGITLADFNAMLAAQDGRCALCSRRFADVHGGAQVDHSHETGCVRSLLCRLCNTKLGWYERNAESIHAYLSPRLLRLIQGDAS